MSSSPNDRAEARRRARMAARGELPPPDEGPVDEPAPQGSFLRRLFPAAPPLPGKRDPLSGFDPSGPMRPIRERLFLLRQAPLVWIGLGIVAGLGYIASLFYARSFLSLVGTFVHFGALIAAGWIGWQRPTLFGTAAGIIGWVLAVALSLYTFAIGGVSPDTFLEGPALVGNFVLSGLTQVGLGFLGGWYGGYLRRRQTHLSAEVRRRR
jgi:hypothetical protein